ncbi:hypothetical protein TEU_08160 [Thermococcus eurythermalis]|uniref:Acyltransferase n=1 Tax=Thermococcus eurythermalis TaxID=1505907 RepID=A0A097QV00_9EURY|nr:hypothetical protein [Thermococcus eurythermalis]AIU70304.1 hypothetical protein TEU_08160 [Thermococcus eurythermalis]
MLLRGVVREPIFPQNSHLEESVRIERPAIVLDFVLANSIEVDDATDDDRVITSSLFGKDRVVVGRNVAIVGNVQSNGKITIGDGSVVFGNVVGREVTVRTNVNVLGNIIAVNKVVIGTGSKIGGYAASIHGTVKADDNVEVFDIFGNSGISLGQDVHIMDYSVYGGTGGVNVKGKISLGEYSINSPEEIMFKNSLNLLSVLVLTQYNPKASLKYLKDNLNSIMDIKSYLKKHNVDIGELEKEFQSKPLYDTIKKALSEVAQTLSLASPSITITNANAPVTITVGNNNVVSVAAGQGDKHLTVNLLELFQKAKNSIMEGSLPKAYSKLVSIREIALKQGNVPEELEEALSIIKNRIRGGVTVANEELKEVLISLLDAAYNKLLKV